jgi:iron complex transport system ATP-binding protein
MKSANLKNGLTSATTPSELRAESVDVGYGGIPIVNDVSLNAARGEVTILIGPNGCGKSTLLKALSRILPTMAGDVTIDDVSIQGIPTKPLARQLSLLPQGPIAPEGLTVRELVAQGRFPYQSLLQQWSSADASAVDAAMAAANVMDFADRPVMTLSGGQRQRCWIAMILAQDTDILLLDEPTTFLDLKVQVDVMSLLRTIAHDKGRTVVVVLHELNVASMFADQLIMMRSGAVVAQGHPNTVMTRENLADVFDLDAHVIIDPISGRPICLPILNVPTGTPNVAVAS